MQYYTTIEQSKKLVELGLNLDTADMVIVKDNTYHNALSAFNGATLCQNYNEIKNKTNYIPCWSLGALIDIMPSMIYKGGETFTLMVHKDVIYHVCYKSHYHLDEIWFSKENLLDAAFEMVVWLFENNYIKKGE